MDEPTPVRWNVCPDCLGRHPDGAACHDERPTGDLSERLDAALRTVGLARNLAAYRDAVLPVVEEALAEQAADIDEDIIKPERAQHEQTIKRAEEAEHTLRAVEIDRDQWRDRAHALRAALDADQPKETT